MLPSMTANRTMLLAQPFLNMRTMATKTYTIKAKDIGAATKAASATSSYYSKATTGVAAKTHATSVKATTARSYNKSDFSTNPASSSPSVASAGGSKSFSASPVSAAPAASSPSYSPYGDDSEPIKAATGSSRVGGDNGQSTDSSMPFPNGATGLRDAVIGDRSLEEGEDWTRSFSGMAVEPFEKGVAEILMKPLDADDIEIKPDGLLYLPEIKYRRILNKAFGPGGWGLAPRSEHSISPKNISREYALVCKGRFVSTARGEQAYFDADNLATASEGCKSNALMRCCKDLGVASELWDPAFIRKFKKQYCEEVFVEHAVTKRKKKLWKRKDQGDFDYPYSKAKF
ncbi:mitochondrial genome maintenance MGM101-domain-containing protein [Linnemannia elongata]|nr:mitochondrial genome maintenance MGM101-domain-containing protein [Linnemannia elongata]